MEFFNLVLHICVAMFFTVSAIRTPYKDTKKVCNISMFVWWACVLIDIIEIVVF